MVEGVPRSGQKTKQTGRDKKNRDSEGGRQGTWGSTFGAQQKNNGGEECEAKGREKVNDMVHGVSALGAQKFQEGRRRRG